MTTRTVADRFKVDPSILCRTLADYAPSLHGSATNETEKPVRVLEDLIAYAVPVGGLVLDIFAGSGSTGRAARAMDRRAVLIEKREAQCEDAAIPVIIMAGGSAGPDLSYTQPDHLDRVAADFPNLNIVVSHGGWPWVHQVLHIAFRRSNIYLSPDQYLAQLPGMDDYIKAADGFLADRFLFASSYPFTPVKDYAAWFKRLQIRPESMEKVLYRNAARLLRLDA